MRQQSGEENQNRRPVRRSNNRHHPRYMYEKMNESRDSEEETKINYMDRKRNYQKTEKEKPSKFRKKRLYQMRRTELEQTT